MACHAYRLEDGELRFVYFNEINNDLAGNKLQDALGMAISEILKDDPEILENIRKTFRERSTFTQITEYKYKTSGIVKTLKSNYKYAPPDMVVATVEDITDQTEKDRGYKQLSMDMQAIFDHIPSPIFYKDKDNKIIHANKYFLELLGTKKEDIENKSEFEIFPETFANGYWKEDLEVIKSKKPKLNFEQRVPTKKGDKWMLTSKIPHLTPDGEVIGVIGVSTDITTIKSIQKELNERIKELTTLYNISDVLMDYNNSLGIQIEKVMKNLVEAFRYPELVNIQIKIGDLIYKSINFESSEFFISEEVESANSIIQIKVFYSKQKEFLDWERNLIKEIAKTLQTHLFMREKNKIIKQHEERYNTLDNSGYFGILKVSLSGTALEFNQYVLDFFDYPAEEFEEINFSDVTHPEDLDKDLNLFNELVEGRIDNYQIEKRYFDKQGNIKWAQIYVNAVIDDSNNVDYAFVLLQDINDRKQAEFKLKESEESLRNLNLKLESIVKERTKELKQSEEMLSSVLESIPDLFFVLDSKGTHLEFRGNESLLYVKPSEFLGKNVKEVLPANLAEKYQNAIKKAIKTKQPEIMEYELSIDGNPHFFEARVLYLTENSVTTVVRDISEKKQLEEELKESELKFRQIAENLEEVVWLGSGTEDKRELIYLNPAFESVFNIRCEKAYENIGSWIDLIHEDDKQKVITALEKMFKNRQKFDIQYRFIKPDGEMRYIWSRAYFLSVDDPNNIRSLGVAQDITAMKKARINLKKSEQKYRQAFHEANLYKDLLAHDMNNILNNINASFELLKMYSSDIVKLKEELNKLTSIIDGQIKKGSSLISNIRKLELIDQEPINLSSVSLYDNLSKAINFIKDSNTHREISIKCNQYDKNLRIKANDFILDVFENILLNSIKHNDNEKVDVKIDVGEIKDDEGELIRITFSDNARGIPDDRKKIIFKPKLESYEFGKGMRLGLSLVKKIISKFNGKILVEDKIRNDYKKGTKFILLIPKA